MAQESPTFVRLVDAGAILSHEHQLHLLDLLGEYRYEIDLDQGVITFFTGDHGTLRARMHLLGTAAPGPQTWLWSWSPVANPLPEDRTMFARTLRDYGTQNGVPEFTTEERPLEADQITWQRIAIAAKTATRFSRGAHFPAMTARGTVLLVLLEHPDLALPAPELARVVRVFGESLTNNIVIAHHRSAVIDYCARRQLPIKQDASTLSIALPDGHITLEFDTADRITALRGSSA